MAPVGPRKPDERERLARKHGTRRAHHCPRINGEHCLTQQRHPKGDPAPRPDDL